ncbi:hypothetical protein SAICODRAFT_23870 [Saitoella complicata NRRL Y-17804]|uniref:uncharacterized protein n=1 Tax=Saitoella complicata (strain BCRC 22490 / CBS 7301 / JCM 7358 / NBRC 10748 / NRRL Y-17804) TaxID=698492 RepID=UPI0008680566|nr:uncharacterized protein SAICODRAFT_23870 [Saitoella complicata NRRL Y-17804]ODQ54602.1 hypothetical protein SAICODRAFT_23870 [Saitoella complicata NRRL Y-17804]
MDEVPYSELSDSGRVLRRARMCALIKIGRSHNEVMEPCKVAPSTLSNITKRCLNSAVFMDVPRSGGPTKHDERDDKRIVRLVRSGVEKNAVVAAAPFNMTAEKPNSAKTVREILHQNGGKSRIKPRKPFLSRKAREERLK